MAPDYLKRAPGKPVPWFSVPASVHGSGELCESTKVHRVGKYVCSSQSVAPL